VLLKQYITITKNSEFLPFYVYNYPVRRLLPYFYIYYIHFISPDRGSKNTQTHTYTIHSHIQIYKYILKHTNNIYTHTAVYVEAIELHDIRTHYFIH